MTTDKTTDKTAARNLGEEAGYTRAPRILPLIHACDTHRALTKTTRSNPGDGLFGCQFEIFGLCVVLLATRVCGEWPLARASTGGANHSDDPAWLRVVPRRRCLSPVAARGVDSSEIYRGKERRWRENSRGGERTKKRDINSHDMEDDTASQS